MKKNKKEKKKRKRVKKDSTMTLFKFQKEMRKIQRA
jgi:hypothetical protein